MMLSSSLSMYCLSDWFSFFSWTLSSFRSVGGGGESVIYNHAEFLTVVIYP